MWVDEPGSKSVELAKKIEASGGYALFQELFHLKRSIDILSQNFAELEVVFGELSKESGAIALTTGPRQKTDFFWLQIHRLLQNYLAAAKALVDHLNRHMAKEENADLRTQYSLRARALGNSTTGMLVKDLRNYFLHYDVGPVCVVVNFQATQGTPFSSINFDCKELLKWLKWSRQSREYLEGLRDSQRPLVILELLRQYQSSMVEFMDWLLAELQRLHEPELKDYREASREYSRLNQELKANIDRDLKVRLSNADRQVDP
jgi:hypothetical protein